MRLTMFSDYTLRVLMYAGSVRGRLITIDETARIYDISRAHLKKVVNTLVRAGYLEGVRGRSGGFRLAQPPAQINLGAVIRETELDFALVECFTADNRCLISRFCRLPQVLNEALNAFAATLDRYTLADLLLSERDFDLPAPPNGLVRGPMLSGVKAGST